MFNMKYNTYLQANLLHTNAREIKKNYLRSCPAPATQSTAEYCKLNQFGTTPIGTLQVLSGQSNQFIKDKTLQMLTRKTTFLV